MAAHRLGPAVGAPLVLAGTASAAFSAALVPALGAEAGRVEARRFPDGEAYVRIVSDVRGRDVVVVQNAHPNDGLVELLLLQDAARDAGAARVATVVPYLGYARQDRAFQGGEAIASRTVARAISHGTDEVITVDPHKDDVLRYFDVPARAVSAVGAIADRLAQWGTDLVLAPDKGARDRAERAAQRIGCAVDHLEKRRVSATEVHMAAKSLAVKGRRVAILDDLIASGGTMREAAKALKAQGAAAVVAACTHGLFAGASPQALLAAGIDRVLCSDTLPAACETVSAAPAVARLLRQVEA